jgi:hypothetical protein
VASAKGVWPGICSHCQGFQVTAEAFAGMVLEGEEAGPTG